MKKVSIIILGLYISMGLIACASKTTLNAPCPNFGAGCSKKPINSWDYQTVS